MEFFLLDEEDGYTFDNNKTIFGAKNSAISHLFSAVNSGNYLEGFNRIHGTKQSVEYKL